MKRNSHLSIRGIALLPARGLSLLCAAALLAGILLISLFAQVSISQAGNDLAADVYRIGVQMDGIHQMTYTDLQAAGLPVDTLDPHNFHLSWMGQEVAIQVVGEEDGRFDPGDAVLFYGQGIGSLYRDGRLPTQKYTDTNVYWLTVNATGGKRMVIKDGAVAGTAAGPFRRQIHLEEDLLYEPEWPASIEADRWYWDRYQVFKFKPAVTKEYSFAVTHPAADSPAGQLTIRLVGAMNRSEYETTYGPNYVQVYLNGHQLTDPPVRAWDVITLTFDVPQGWFVKGSNVVTVSLMYEEAPGSSTAIIWTDWLEVAYYSNHVAEDNALAFCNDSPGAWRYTVTGFAGSDVEVYDISNMTAVQRFANTSVADAGSSYTLSFGDQVTGAHRYLALRPSQRLSPVDIELVTHLTSPYTPVDLKHPTSGADYVLISHKDFWEQAKALADHRAISHAVALVDVQEIYDQFNGGLLSAEAIRDFLGYAYDNWPEPRPAYVLLLGDGTYDERQLFDTSLPTYIPPFMAWSDFEESRKELAIDNRFVTLTGSDKVLELYLGRLPANSPAEAQAMVDKIIAYETTPPVDNFNQHVLFVADRLDLGGGDFHGYSDELADGYADPPSNTVEYLPPQYIPHKVYLGRTCTLDNVAECRAAITQTLNITGALVTNYIGHGYLDKWAADLLLTRRAIDALTNGDRLPVMLAMACSTASFADPNPSQVSIGETAVRDPGRGAVAYLGRSGSGLSGLDQAGERAIFLALFHDEMALGPAIERGRQVANNHLMCEGECPPRGSDARTWTLLGDPALKLQLFPLPPSKKSDYQISKSVSAGRTVFNYGDTVTLTIQITNTGETMITTLPLREVYDPAYLTYGPCGGQHSALPQPDDYLDDGQLDWSDLTAPAPYGFGADLAPGASFTVVVAFTAAYAAGSPTEQSAAIHDARADPDGLVGPLPEVSLPDRVSSTKLAIYTYPWISELRGIVWHDANGDGEMNGDSEPGIAGVKLNIYWDDGDVSFESAAEDAFYGTTHTGPSEEWPFAEHGTYSVQLPHAPHYCHQSSVLWIEVDERDTAPAGILDNMALTTEQTYGPNPRPVPLRTAGGCLEPLADGDFGYARLASVGGTVWSDTDRNGQRNIDHEPGFSNVQVNLYDRTGNRTAVANTDASGHYTFTHLAPGAYRIEVDASAFHERTGMLYEWLASPQNVGPDTSDSDGHPDTHDVAIDLVWEQAVTGTDFGFREKPTGLILSQFGAEVQERHVRLTWQTASELNLLGFNLLRQVGDNGESQAINSELVLAQLPGRDAGAQYVYADEDVMPGLSYRCTLVGIRLDGTSEEFGTVSVDVPGR